MYAEGYRYGFQGQEEDSETGWVEYKYRMHNPEIGRFFSVDPLASKYPHNSPYAFSENKVIQFIELEGLEVAHPSIYSGRAQAALIAGKTSENLKLEQSEAAGTLIGGAIAIDVATTGG